MKPLLIVCLLLLHVQTSQRVAELIKDLESAKVDTRLEAMEDLAKNQEEAQWTLERTKAGHPTESHHVMARVSHFQELEKRFIPGSEDRIKGSHGFDDKRAH